VRQVEVQWAEEGLEEVLLAVAAVVQAAAVAEEEVSII